MAFFDSITAPCDDRALKEAYDSFSEGSYKNSFASFSEIPGPEAQYCLAFHYLNGNGVKRDVKKAFELFRESMDSGYVPAISEVAQCYGYGIGVRCDDAKAFELFSRAAEESDPYGMAMVSLMYANGDGVKRNAKLADEWNERCEEAGDLDEIEEIGLRYLTSGNTILGRMLLMRSAVMGSPVSAKALYCIYSFGKGVHEDDDEASDWEDTADCNGWDEVSLDDLRGHEKWFSQFIDVDDLEPEDD